jgi:solute carrier family 25 citrate transporter 1
MDYKGKKLFPASKFDANKSPLQSILAGGISGGIEVCINYPIEYIKTQLQLQDKKNPYYNGIWDCVKKTVKTNGVTGLYTGLSPLFYMSIPKVACRFFAFEEAKKALKNSEGKLTTGRTFLAGLCAGVSEAVLVVTPMETIKVKFIHDQRSGSPKYRNFVHGINEIVKQEGFSGIYKGLTPTIIRQGSNQAIRFVVYDKVVKALSNGQEPLVWHTLTAGGVAGAASVFGNTPVDVIKTKMQGLDANKYKNSWECAKDVWVQDGFKGFYKGTVPRLARVCGDVALVMTLYSKITEMLDVFFKK